VWAGDQVLWELRAPGADGDDLESTTAAGAAEPRFYGRVSYLHAGGIDRPLSIWKEGVGSVRPHQNWRGQFARGTWGAGPLQGRSSECAYGGAPDCISLQWPGYRTNAWHQQSRAGDPDYWMGGLVDGMRDVTGQVYMRNRYYDPATGQFTQPDPIGIAGGLNSYGFAAGDPVSYSDPYGLCADHLFKKRGLLGRLGIGPTRCPGRLTKDEYGKIESAAAFLSAEAGGRILGMLEAGDIRRVGRTGNGMPAGANWRGRDAILVEERFFGSGTGYSSDGERAWVLGHELAHLLQAENGSLLYEATLYPIQQYLDAQKESPLFPIVQRDADKYACNNTTAGSRGQWDHNPSCKSGP
jgi:RHS repeat-associated protein